MTKTLAQKRNHPFFRSLCAGLAFVFFVFAVFPSVSQAQSVGAFLNLPVPGTMIGASPAFAPAIIRGMTVYPDNPLKFDFIVDTGDNDLKGQALKDESQKLIKYFLASLTTPENEFWVNLSPYESGRIIPEALGVTEMGRDMLAQDYILKQLTASLMYPEKDLGRAFWQKVYEKAQKLYGTREIPVNTFNKVWIMPDKAVVYEHDSNVFVIERHLKVMLEEDYQALDSQRAVGFDAGAPSTAQAMQKTLDAGRLTLKKTTSVQPPSSSVSDILRELIIPEIEKEVNEGQTFATVRQIYNSMILATWYKKRLRESLLGQVYVNQNKTKGIDLDDKNTKQQIYEQYLAAFKKGVYNYIKEDTDALTQEPIARKYFSGGLAAGVLANPEIETFRGEPTTLPPSVQKKVNDPASHGKDVLENVTLLENGKSGIENTVLPKNETAQATGMLSGAVEDLTVSGKEVSTLPQLVPTRLNGNNEDGAASSAIAALFGRSSLWNKWMLTFSSPKTKINAMRRLARAHDHSAAERIAGLLSDPNSDVRVSARVALKRIGATNDEVIDGNIAALSGAEQSRFEAAKELAQLGRGVPRVYEALQFLLKATSPQERVVSARAFGDLGNPQAKEPLLAMLADENQEVRAAVRYALKKLGATKDELIDADIAALKSGDLSARLEAAEELGNLKDNRAENPLLGLLTNDDYELRAVARAALLQIETVNINHRTIILDGYKSDLPLLRRQGGRLLLAEAIEQIGNLDVLRAEDSLRLLFPFLGNDDATVRRATRNALHKLGATKDELIDGNIAALSGVEQSRFEAARELSQLGRGVPRVYEALQFLLKATSPQERVSGARAFGDLGNPQAKEPLLAMLVDENQEVRAAARKSLDQLGATNDELVTAYFAAFVADKSRGVRTSAEQALGLGPYQGAEGSLKVDPNDPRLKAYNEVVRQISGFSDMRVNVVFNVAFAIAMQGHSFYIKYRPQEVVEEPGESWAGSEDDIFDHPLSGTKTVTVIVAKEILQVVDVNTSEVNDFSASSSIDGEQNGAEVPAGNGKIVPLTGAAKDLTVSENGVSELGKDTLTARTSDSSSSAIRELLNNSVWLNIWQLSPVFSTQRRLRAINNLVRSNDPLGRKSIEALLSDDNSEIKARAAMALGQLNDQRVKGPLLALLSHDSWEVRSSARGALDRLKTSNDQLVGGYIKALSASKQAKVEAAKELVFLGRESDEVYEALKSLLKDTDPVVVSIGIESLVALGNRAIIPTLVDMLNKETNPKVMGTLVFAMGEFKVDDAKQRLKELLRDDMDSDLFSQILKALEALGDPVSDEFLIKKLRLQNRLSSIAAEQLGKRQSSQAKESLLVALGYSDPVTRRVARNALKRNYPGLSDPRIKAYEVNGRASMLVRQVRVDRRDKIFSIIYPFVLRGVDIKVIDDGPSVYVPDEYSYDYYDEYLLGKGRWTTDQVRVLRRDNGTWKEIMSVDPYGRIKNIDASQGDTKAASAPVGGIDFNSKALDLQIKRDGQGVPLPLPQQQIKNMKIDGFYPVIINISPVQVPLLLSQKPQPVAQLSALK